jgi:hypothetical protein
MNDLGKLAVAACVVGSLATLCASCSRKSTSDAPTAGGPAPAEAGPETRRAMDATADGAAPTTKAKPDPKPFSADDTKKRLSYIDAHNNGRAATAAHHYDEAIAAFDQAGGADQDGRAQAERGYAKFLFKHYDLALKDFEAAELVPANADLAAQIWFNRGLTYAALGRSGEADVAFYRSNRLNSTKAAAARLVGKKICTVAVDPAPGPARP